MAGAALEQRLREAMACQSGLFDPKNAFVIATIVYRQQIQSVFPEYFQMYYNDQFKAKIEDFIEKAKVIIPERVN